MRKVISLSEKTNNGSMWSPEDCLRQCLDDIGKRGALKGGKKLLVLSLDDSDGNYSTSFVQAGMSMSQCLTLCEVAKTTFLKEMKYIPD